jgi:hypothetical protein
MIGAGDPDRIEAAVSRERDSSWRLFHDGASATIALVGEVFGHTLILGLSWKNVRLLE